MMMSETPLPTLALSRSAKLALHRALEQREAHDVFDIPTTKRQRGALSGGNTCSARARSAHAIGAERVARAVDGSQRLRRPAHRRAAPSARSAVRRAPSA